jgi:26S proteasome regulatory subunit N1
MPDDKKPEEAKPKVDEKKKKDDKKKDDDDDLSEEDQALQAQMELLVTRTSDPEPALRLTALETMVQEVRTSTSSMTSVPKPLKFLRPHFGTLKENYEKASAGPAKTMMADVLSLLAMTMGEDSVRESLSYKLLGSREDLGSWGHEYVRHLAGEIGAEYNDRLVKAEAAEAAKAAAAVAEAAGGDAVIVDASDAEEIKSVDELLPLILAQITPFFMKHNAEAEAIDLLMEVGRIEELIQYVDKTNCDRICAYLGQLAQYVPEPEDGIVLTVAVNSLRKLSRYPEALMMAVRLQDDALLEEILSSCDDPLVQRQMAYMLARVGCRPEAEEELARLMDGAHTTEHYLELARDLDVVEPKAPEDVYKSHLEKRPAGSSNVDSARQNLAGTFVNGLLNCGFGTDKLLLTEGNKWLYKNKEHGMMSAAASLGLLLLWDVDGGLTQIDKFLYSTDDNIKAGALLAVGVLSCGTRNECDPALALLTEYAEEKHPPAIKMGALFGLGLAYAGSKKEEVMEALMPVVSDEEQPLEVVAMAALSLGLAFASSCNADVAQALMTVLMERPQATLEKDSMTRLICLGVGLLYLGKQQAVEVAIELAKCLEGAVGEYCSLTLETCAYAGSGNVLKVQRYIQICGEHAPKEEEEEESSVPLGLALLAVSHPSNIAVVDALSKMSHDPDADVATAAIVSLGLVAAGTNNSRVATALRSLASYYSKEPGQLFAVRLAQGLTHAGKGLVTLSPYHPDRSVCHPVVLAGIVSLMHILLDFNTLVLGKHHFLLFVVACTIRPRMLVTLDEDLKPLPVSVRVGQAVDTVGQAGRPKAITGFQTHTTPVLLAAGERAELATDEFLPLTSLLEGVVILKKNPDHVPTTLDDKTGKTPEKPGNMRINKPLAAW